MKRVRGIDEAVLRDVRRRRGGRVDDGLQPPGQVRDAVDGLAEDPRGVEGRRLERFELGAELVVLDVLGLRRIPKGHVVLAPGVRRRLHGVVLALVEHLLELRGLPPTEIVGVEVAGAVTKKMDAAMVGRDAREDGDLRQPHRVRAGTLTRRFTILRVGHVRAVVRACVEINQCVGCTR